MSVESSFLERLPDPVPKSAIRVETDIDIVTGADGDLRTTYPLPKRPFERLRSVQAVVDGVETSLTIDDDVVAVDTNSDGAVDSILFTGVLPDVGTTATVEYDVVPIIDRYTSVYDEDIDFVGDRLDNIIESKSVETATGDELDRIGTQFGSLGRRSTRTDSVYRAYLRSLVPTFTATGTKGDVKLAVSAATGVPTDEISITEDTEQLGFYVVITSSDVIAASAELSEIIELASPSGVNLLNDPIVRTEALFLAFNFDGETVATNEGLGTGTVGGSTLGSRDGFAAHVDP